MTKSEFVKALAQKANISQEKAREFLDAGQSIVIDTVKSGESVLFTGFGSFYVSNRSERKGRNPQTGEAITIPAFKLPAFKVGAVFKNALNGKEKPQPKKPATKKPATGKQEKPTAKAKKK